MSDLQDRGEDSVMASEVCSHWKRLRQLESFRHFNGGSGLGPEFGEV